MPYQRYDVIQHKAELRHAALAANLQDFPELEEKVNRLGELLTLLRELTAEQARLTAARQGVSKRIAELTDETRGLMTFLDVTVRLHYGKSSEKLAEFGIQPYRGRARGQRMEPELLIPPIKA